MKTNLVLVARAFNYATGGKLRSCYHNNPLSRTYRFFHKAVTRKEFPFQVIVDTCSCPGIGCPYEVIVACLVNENDIQRRMMNYSSCESKEEFIKDRLSRKQYLSPDCAEITVTSFTPIARIGGGSSRSKDFIEADDYLANLLSFAAKHGIKVAKFYE